MLARHSGVYIFPDHSKWTRSMCCVLMCFVHRPDTKSVFVGYMVQEIMMTDDDLIDSIIDILTQFYANNIIIIWYDNKVNTHFQRTMQHISFFFFFSFNCQFYWLLVYFYWPWLTWHDARVNETWMTYMLCEVLECLNTSTPAERLLRLHLLLLLFLFYSLRPQLGLTICRSHSRIKLTRDTQTVAFWVYC